MLGLSGTATFKVFARFKGGMTMVFWISNSVSSKSLVSMSFSMISSASSNTLVLVLVLELVVLVLVLFFGVFPNLVDLDLLSTTFFLRGSSSLTESLTEVSCV